MTNKIYIVMKGWCGLGDRLQVLSCCLSYCKLFDAALCVDWRDSMWGQGVLDFGNYFEVIDIPIVTIEEISIKMERGTQVIPHIWTPKLMRETPDSTQSIKYNCNYNCQSNWQYNNQDVILVFNSYGRRRYNCINLVQNIRLVPNAQEAIKKRLHKLTLPASIIHIRGTDRIPSKNRICEVFDKLEIDYKMLPQTRCFVVTDMEILLTEWLKKHSECESLNDSSCTRRVSFHKKYSRVGIHFISKHELSLYNSSKHELNLDCISDFVAICFASNAIGNNNSCFYSMARNIHNLRISLSSWFNSWTPPTFMD